LSRCIECTGEDKTVECSVRRHSARRALSRCADRAQEKNSLSSETEKSPRRDLYRVVEHPVDSARSCLSKEVPGGHQILHLKEKKKD
jgi:hypothetical protein